MLFAAFPLADQACGHVEITGENRLAGPLPQSKGTNLIGLEWPHRRKAQVVELTHSTFRQDASGVDRRHFFHRTPVNVRGTVHRSSWSVCYEDGRRRKTIVRPTIPSDQYNTWCYSS